MEQIGLALILFGAFWVGCAAGYLAMRLRAQVAYEKGRIDSTAEISALTERLNTRDAQLSEALLQADAGAHNIASQHNELTIFNATVSELTVRLEAMKDAAAEKALPANVAEVLARLENAAQGDLDQRHALLGQIMEPLKNSLDKVDSRIAELERDRLAAFSSLELQVETMLRSQASLQADTAHLAGALRSPASRGRWGEVQLRRVVELAGMISHCDFVEFKPAAERPGLIVQLPNNRRIVVDSQIPITAYLDSIDAADEPARTEKRRQFAAQVRNRVTQLSAKSYWAQFPQTPEFVVAFLPGEAFFSAALEFDPELLEFGVERRVILATPTTLIALLRAVAWGWSQECVAANAREIRDAGKSLFERLQTLTDNFNEVQQGLTRTTAAFNRTVSSFESTVIPAARRLSELGATEKNEIPSPQPLDSTPRSIHLLAEAAAPA